MKQAEQGLRAVLGIGWGREESVRGPLRACIWPKGRPQSLSGWISVPTSHGS